MTVTFDDLTSRAQHWSLDDFVAETNRLLPEVVPSAASQAKLEVNARLVRHYTTEGVLPKPLKDGIQARYDTDHLVRVLALRRLLAEGFASAVAGAFLARHDREALARFLLGELKLDLGLAAGGPPSRPGNLDHLAPAVRERLAAMRERAGLPPLGAEPRPDTLGERPKVVARMHAASIDAPIGGALDFERDDARHDDGHASTYDVEVEVDARFESGPGARNDATPVGDRRALRPNAGSTFTRYELLDGLELHVRDDFEDPTTPAAWNTLRDALLARLERIAVERSIRR